MTKLYVLCFRDTKLHFSPYVWRIILALKLKGIEYETEFLTLSEVGPKIKELTGGKWTKVPVVEFDDGSLAYDSFDIATEIEKRYPSEPKIFPNGLSNAKFYEKASSYMISPVFKRAGPAILKSYKGPDEDIFRQRMQQFLGEQELEEYFGDRESLLEPADASFKALRAALKAAPYVEGEKPSFSDFIFVSLLQWILIICPEDFDIYVRNNPDAALRDWYTRIDKLFNGYLSETQTVNDL